MFFFIIDWFFYISKYVNIIKRRKHRIFFYRSFHPVSGFLFRMYLHVARMRTGRCHVHRCNDAAQCNNAADCVLIVQITHHHLDRWWIDVNKIASHDPISSWYDRIVSYDTSQRFTMHGACFREYEISRSSCIGNSYYNDSKRNQSSEYKL